MGINLNAVQLVGYKTPDFELHAAGRVSSFMVWLSQ